MLERTIKIGNLFDFYGDLLTDKQQQIVKLYFYHDLSLGEIAEEYEISRQAVYDNLKRAEEALEDYEANLSLVKRHKEMQEQVDNLKEMINKISEQISKEELRILQEIADKLAD
ncbi:YlxM family DNA-binding protein [Selenihalanaerobacter shriftii]|uniref:UPF0122 protein SAMN02745118_01385 n=1 Tax=Selenihalanaerobacter shriftii TaxID=142842 RepID=A0A1T4M9F0_9FIRM|nr:YlxM family DNA-binding protein [Selenihalanaerobacter shriftii]SJZ63334.1 hypothetical protein SAMN02745118_01385 [Selenihalanaerobacter shriftii]